MKCEEIRLAHGRGHSASAPWTAASGTVAVVVVLAGYLWLLTRGAGWLDGDALRGLAPEQRAAEIDSMRGYLMQYGTGLFALGALVYTGRNFRLSREGHVTDRYTKAIEQLGSESLDVRLGAIYALERIMIDSPRDHPAITEVLAAFVREHSAAAASASDSPLPVPDAGRRPQAAGTPPKTDVRAAMAVLGRRPKGRAERGSLDLRHTTLATMDLSCANLSGALLLDADLSGADLSDALLPGADLSRANLRNADLPRADLRGARLFGTDLSSSKLRGAHLSGAWMSGAKLHTADLSHADLSSALLVSADLSDASLVDVDLSSANLHGADMRGACLDGTHLAELQRTSVKGPSSAESLQSDHL